MRSEVLPGSGGNFMTGSRRRGEAREAKATAMQGSWDLQ